jgi:hypothetical protein
MTEESGSESIPLTSGSGSGSERLSKVTLIKKGNEIFLIYKEIQMGGRLQSHI